MVERTQVILLMSAEGRQVTGEAQTRIPLSVMAAVMLALCTGAMAYATEDVQGVLVSGTIIPTHDDIVYEKNGTYNALINSSGSVVIDCLGPTYVVVDIEIVSASGWAAAVEPSTLEFYPGEEGAKMFTWTLKVPPQTDETLHDTVTISGRAITNGGVTQQLDDATVTVEVQPRPMIFFGETDSDAVEGDLTMMHGLPGYLMSAVILISVAVTAILVVRWRMKKSKEKKPTSLN